MAAYLVPPLYAAFVWWFSTGAVLLLVGRSESSDRLRVVSAGALLIAAICGLSISANDPSVTGAYVAFSAVILLWGVQEIAFLAGWLTGPRPEPCPAGATGLRRLSYALQAILYHELSLLTCGAIVLAHCWDAPNQVALWTFASLWVLRQSSKINLFLGVPVTNDELMPEPVAFLKSYFARRSVSAFFPISVTLSIAVLVILVQRVVEVAATPFEIVGLTLVSTLFALGVLEHWFMLLPLPAVTLWGWGVQSSEEAKMDSKIIDAAIMDTPADGGVQLAGAPPTSPDSRSPHAEASSAKPPRHMGTRQRLEDQFRQAFLEQHPRSDLAAARLTLGAEPATRGNGRTS